MPNPEYRTVTHEDGDTCIIAIVQRTPENDQLTDEEIVTGFDHWKREQRHLRAVDSE
jgi:hypothetical protein